MSRFFINRPIVAMVIAILMVIVGAVSILILPTAQFPEIVPPEVVVQATYVGADAVTVEQAVATPLEQQMTGVDNMNYMYSINANNGLMQLTVNFAVGTDPNTDQILAQIRTSQANSQLPPDVIQFGLTVQKSATSPLVLLSLYSPKGTYDKIFLTNYASINLNDPLTRVPGVGRVQIFGGGQYAMRCWVKPDQLAKLGVTVPAIISAIQTQNTVNPAGQIGSEPVPRGQDYTYAVRARGRLETADEFGQIILRANPDGSILKLRDVARMELGAQTYNQEARFNGKPAAVIAVYQLPGTNALQAVDGVRRLMEELKQRFPSDMAYEVSLDTTLAVREGMREIVITLLEAIALVVVVVFVFLQGWRATLIPLAAVPVSLIGTFAVFPLLGFSINTLSLFGLVLAIGLVVDDAIVVVEAVEHHIEEGLSPRDAAFKAMKEVSGPVVGIALVLSSVFVPIAFVGGIQGRLNTQFAVTIAISVLISAFNALTLSPALSALLLRPRRPGRGPLARFFALFNRVFDRSARGYVRWSHGLIRKPVIAVAILVAFIAVDGLVGRKLPTSFIPEEDQGYLLANVQLPAAASLERTEAVAKKVEGILAKTEGVQAYSSIIGFSLLSRVSSTYNAFMFIQLKPWSQREGAALEARGILRNLNRALATQVPEAMAFAFSPPAIPGFGNAGGFSMWLQDRSGGSVEFLDQNVKAFLEAARKRPELTGVNSVFTAGIPQVYADVDRDKVLTQGIAIGDVYQTMQTYLGGLFVNQFNRFGRQWRVFLQAEGESRLSEQDIGQYYVRNGQGGMVPLSTLVSTRRLAGPEYTNRFNLYRAAQVLGSAAPGYSSGQALAALEQVAAQVLPREMGYGFADLSYQEKKASGTAGPIFALSLGFVFLILAALYESWSLPFSVLLSVPVAVLGAFLGLYLRNFDLGIFAQIGLAMLIGLAAKNAILIVEFARDEMKKGRPLVEAALEGARLRLRPILMTSFAFIFGMVPLWIATGAGAIARQILGTVVITGMLAATAVAIFIIPVLFVLVERLANRRGRQQPAPVPTEPEATP